MKLVDTPDLKSGPIGNIGSSPIGGILLKMKNMQIIFFILHVPAIFDVPTPWQYGFQEPATQIMESLIDFHHDLMFYLFIILGFVIAMMIQIGFAYSEEQRFIYIQPWWTHDTKLEIIWTIVPMYILYIIGGPSFVLLYSMEELTNPQITIKAIGRQWYWHYEYGDFDKTIAFDAYMIPDTESKLRLLEVTNEIVIPTQVQIRLLTTASDVLHSWTIPSLGIKLDACPGRLNQTAILMKRTGFFYGQCSEICGINHGFMPIALRSVNWAQFRQWINFQLSI